MHDVAETRKHWVPPEWVKIAPLGYVQSNSHIKNTDCPKSDLQSHFWTVQKVIFNKWEGKCRKKVGNNLEPLTDTEVTIMVPIKWLFAF